MGALSSKIRKMSLVEQDSSGVSSASSSAADSPAAAEFVYIRNQSKRLRSRVVVATRNFDLQKYVSTFFSHCIMTETDMEHRIQRGKRDLFVACLQSFGKMSSYMVKQGQFTETFDVKKLGNDFDCSYEFDIILPSEKFPFGAIFKSFDMGGFAAVLENGVYYVSCFKHHKYTDSVIDGHITTLSDAAEEARRKTDNANWLSSYYEYIK